jgi:hypothetical protein
MVVIANTGTAAGMVGMAMAEETAVRLLIVASASTAKLMTILLAQVIVAATTMEGTTVCIPLSSLYSEFVLIDDTPY